MSSKLTLSRIIIWLATWKFASVLKVVESEESRTVPGLVFSGTEIVFVVAASVRGSSIDNCSMLKAVV